MALYVLVLLLAELLQTSVFGGLHLGLTPCVMPAAVACISLFEGSQRGCIFGLVGGCIWAWSTQLSYYGAYVIVMLTLIGTIAGLVTERFLLRGIKTALAITVPAMLLTEGIYLLALVLLGQVPASAFLTVLLPEVLIALILCLALYPLTAKISQIGGFHG
jgi:cell shape-determining protein MreD